MKETIRLITKPVLMNNVEAALLRSAMDVIEAVMYMGGTKQKFGEEAYEALRTCVIALDDMLCFECCKYCGNNPCECE